MPRFYQVFSVLLFSLIINLTVIVSTSSIFAAEIISVQPSFIKMRQAADVVVNVNDFEKSMQLSLIPGGAYVSKAKNLDSTSLIHQNLLITAEDKSAIVIYQATKSTWQEISFIETNINSSILELFLSEQSLFALTANEKIQINIDQPSRPKIISRKSIENQHGDINPTKNKNCALSRNKQFCAVLNQTNEIQVWKADDKEEKIISRYISNAVSHNIIIANDLIAVADGTTGITLLDISNDGKLTWRGSYNKLGNIIHVAYSSGHLLSADDQGVLSVFDISNPNTPLLISDFHTHLPISAIQFHKKQGYILTSEDDQKKIINVDFTANSSPMISTLGVNQGGSRRSFIDNNILYVADWFSGLHLYDIRNPLLPRLLSSFHTPGSPKGVVVRNGVAFVADDDHGLQIIDVSNPRKPELISEIPLSGLTYTMKLIDNLLYIASHRGGFHIMDVSNPASPLLISTYDTPSKAWALEYKDGLLYVADDSTGLMVFDVKNPAKPKLINLFTPHDSENKPFTDNGFAEDVILKNNRAYIAFFGLGLVIVDITNPLALKQLALLPTPGNARGIEIKDELLYLASWEAGVQIINIALDSKPYIVGHYDTKGAVWGLSVKDKIVYAMDWWGGVKIIDATRADKPTLLSQYQTAGVINDLLYHNRFIYTAHGSRGLQVYDASNDLNPVWATGVDINGDARSIAINQKTALAIIAAGDGGIAIADISNPFHATLLGQLNLSASISFVQTKNNFVFAAEKNGDLFVIDIQNPRAPLLLKRIPLSVNQLTINDDKLFVLNKKKTVISFFANKLTDFDNGKHIALNEVSDGLQFIDKAYFISQSKNQLSSCSIEQTSVQCKPALKIPTHLIAMHIVKTRLYATTSHNDLYVFNISDDYSLTLSTIYPTSHRIESISTSKDGIFFGGQAIIASGKRLPQLDIIAQEGSFKVNIPSNMPKGAYHLALTHADGSQSISKNALTIGFPKLKSKFTLEQLKAIMKQKNFDGKAPTKP